MGSQVIYLVEIEKLCKEAFHTLLVLGIRLFQHYSEQQLQASGLPEPPLLSKI